MSGAWPAGDFLIATPDGPEKRAGYIYKGLGMWQLSAASPKGRVKARWSLTHLGSGHRLAVITGDVATAFPIATEVAEAGDWTFDGLTGWKNQFPDAAERFREIQARHSKALTRGQGGFSDENTAREIAMAAA